MYLEQKFYHLLGIKSKNDELDTSLEKVSTLASVEQPKAILELNESAKELVKAKQEYNDKILNSSNDDIQEAGITRPYETEYLQTVIGNHAKDKGINLRYELRQASSGVSGEYDMDYTITGSYVSISEFVAAIENNSSLNFRIENFRLLPTAGDTENLQATFKVRAINVKVDRINTNPNQADNTNTDNQTNNS